MNVDRCSSRQAFADSARRTAIAENDTRVVSSRRLGHVSKRKIATTEEQPKPTAELRREGRLARIAEALASGATVTDIAEAEGIGRTLVSREANSPECRQLIAEFVGDEWQEMRALLSIHARDRARAER
jgi:hypothetical protein